ncbi:hypothetical protein HPB47_024371 [Ixodes persulcatus]|uniref:Uncharacterized protein n=1 Tax=Ixodes persulcatus TaxID=34615 RepID=A0AC60Q4I1_IXOPE|nr:hypothetical protein HPB47_024371 [Ixodes persulcatus]
MKSGKSCFKCRDCTKRRNPSSTVLIDNDDGAGATPISAGSKLNIGTGDCDGTAQVGVSTEILALLTELTFRLDVLTAEVRLLRANNSALTTEVAQLREAVVNQTVADATKDAQSLGSPSAVSSYAEAVTSTILRLRLVRLVTSEIEHVNLFLSTTSVEMLQMREAEEIVNLPTRMATLSSRKGGPSPPREPTLKVRSHAVALSTALRMRRRFTSREFGFCARAVPTPCVGKRGLVCKQRVGKGVRVRRAPLSFVQNATSENHFGFRALNGGHGDHQAHLTTIVAPVATPALPSEQPEITSLNFTGPPGFQVGNIKFGGDKKRKTQKRVTTLSGGHDKTTGNVPLVQATVLETSMEAYPTAKSTPDDAQPVQLDPDTNSEDWHMVTYKKKRRRKESFVPPVSLNTGGNPPARAKQPNLPAQVFRTYGATYMKGVIYDIFPLEEDPKDETLNSDLESERIRLVSARRLGKSDTAVLTFDGLKLPRSSIHTSQKRLPAANVTASDTSRTYVLTQPFARVAAQPTLFQPRLTKALLVRLSKSLTSGYNSSNSSSSNTKASSTKSVRRQMIRILRWNCRGLGQRAAELRTRFLERPDQRPDVLLIQEANSVAIKIRGFTSYACPSIPKHQSGPRSTLCVKPGYALVYVRTDWPQHQIDLAQHCNDSQEIVAVRATTIKNNNVIFVSAYLRPGAKRTIDHDWISYIHQIYPQEQKLYGGDFNLHHPAWGYTRQTKEAEQLMERMTMCHLHLMNVAGTKTRMAACVGQGDTSPDLTWTSNVFYQHHVWKCLPDTRGSDHFPIEIQFSPTRKPCHTLGAKRKVHITHWDRFRQELVNRPNSEEIDFTSSIQNALKTATISVNTDEDTPTPDLHLACLWAKRLQLLQRYRRGRKTPATRQAVTRATVVAKEYAKHLETTRWLDYSPQPRKTIAAFFPMGKAAYHDVIPPSSSTKQGELHAICLALASAQEAISNGYLATPGFLEMKRLIESPVPHSSSRARRLVPHINLEHGYAAQRDRASCLRTYNRQSTALNDHAELDPDEHRTLIRNECRIRLEELLPEDPDPLPSGLGRRAGVLLRRIRTDTTVDPARIATWSQNKSSGLCQRCKLGARATFAHLAWSCPDLAAVRSRHRPLDIIQLESWTHPPGTEGARKRVLRTLLDFVFEAGLQAHI